MIYDSKWIWGPDQTCPFLLENRDFFSVFKKINPRLHVTFLIRFCPSTRKRHSDWQQYHLMGACPYNGLSVRDVILLKSRRRQRERQKKKRIILEKQQLCTCSTLFCTFLCRHCTTATWNSLKWRFMEDVNTRLQISLSPSKLGGGPQEFNSRQIHLHSTEILHQSKKSRPTAKSFKQWRFGYRRRRRWQSSLLRVRENGVVKNLHSGDSICKKMRSRWQFSLDGGR